jgi:hypothetical protein
MAIYSDKITFKLPSPAEVALTDNLVSVIQSHHRKSREHMFHLCIIAYGLRTHNLMKPKRGAGGNKQGLVYKPQFIDWYDSNSLEDVYRTRQNFLLYAMAGRLLNYVRWQVGAKYIEHLPGSMTALYALSEIVWSQGDKATDASRKLFDKALIQPIKDGSKNNAFIHPHVTRKEVDEWRANQTGKVSPTIKVAKLVKNDPRTVVVATIKVHKDLFKFTRESGKKLNGPKLTDVKTLTEKLEKLIIEFDAGKSRFALDSHFDDVSREYKKAESPDFGKNILAKEKSKPVIAKKQLSKKL